MASFSKSESSDSASSQTVPNSHVVLTFVPATFSNLLRLMAPPDDHDSPEADAHSSHDSHCGRAVPKDYSKLQTESSSEPAASEPAASSAAEDPPANNAISERDLQESRTCELTASLSDTAVSSHGAGRKKLLLRQRSAGAADLRVFSQSRCRSLTPGPLPGGRGGEDGSASPEEFGAPRGVRHPVSVTLPVYVYDAPVSAVIGRLVYQGGVRQWRDTYLDLTTRADENARAGSEPSYMEYRPEASEGASFLPTSFIFHWVTPEVGGPVSGLLY